jgi:hypothetical protein
MLTAVERLHQNHIIARYGELAVGFVGELRTRQRNSALENDLRAIRFDDEARIVLIPHRNHKQQYFAGALVEPTDNRSRLPVAQWLFPSSKRGAAIVLTNLVELRFHLRHAAVIADCERHRHWTGSAGQGAAYSVG